jgi:AraC-like DNA-binding protein
VDLAVPGAEVKPRQRRLVRVATPPAATGGDLMVRRATITDALDEFRHALPPADPRLSWQVRKIVDVVHAGLFDDTLSVGWVKGRCRIRDNNVSCRFKHEMGVSIRDYIESLRLDAAGRLLKEGSFTASEVGVAVGYANPQTFYRAFERRYQCTPGLLRRCGALAERETDA